MRFLWSSVVALRNEQRVAPENSLIMLSFRVTFEALRRNRHQALNDRTDVPEQTKARSKEYRVTLGILRCRLRGRSYSIVTLTHSTGQHYGFASIGGSSHENSLRSGYVLTLFRLNGTDIVYF